MSSKDKRALLRDLIGEAFEEFDTKCVREGRRAMGRYSNRVTAACGSITFVCSVDLDKGLRTSMPSDPRWDYGLELRLTKGNRCNKCAMWVEVHPAENERNFREVVAKLDWLRRKVFGRVPKFRVLTQAWQKECDGSPFVWIPSGRVGRLPHEKEFRKLARKHGLRFGGRNVSLECD